MDTDRTLLEEAFAPELVGGRTPSAAMLAWFLLNVERMDPELVPDAICDGPSDKGIDAIVIDDDLSEITLYQGKRMTSTTKTQGDKELKNFLGVGRYFQSAATVQGLLESKPNEGLQNLLVRNDIVTKVANGYRVRRLVFVTNGPLDASAAHLVDALAGHEPQLDIWPLERITAIASQVKQAALRPEEITITASAPPILDDLDGQARLAIALVPATELVKLPGIDDMTLFSRNVRLSAGNTRINRELAKTVADADGHSLFSASHNGITVLTNSLTASPDDRTLTLAGVSVVNGCQSLLALHKGRNSLTPSLKLLVKIIDLPEASSELSDIITYRANNQNAVNMRDQRSTDGTQIGLQRQVADQLGSAFAYTIKAGEKTSANRSLDNTLAAQLITAVYREQPWSAVRKVRLFDEDYHAIFTNGITAHSLYLLQLIDEAVTASRDELEGELRSSFSSVRFTIAALLADVIRLTPLGTQLLIEPSRWLPQHTERIATFLTERARDVASNVNGYVQDKEAAARESEKAFDAKTVFKSAAGVKPLSRENAIIARRVDSRDPGYLFNLDPDLLTEDQV